MCGCKCEYLGIRKVLSTYIRKQNRERKSISVLIVCPEVGSVLCVWKYTGSDMYTNGRKSNLCSLLLATHILFSADRDDFKCMCGGPSNVPCAQPKPPHSQGRINQKTGLHDDRPRSEKPFPKCAQKHQERALFGT